jgi:hypothetical protein
MTYKWFHTTGGWRVALSIRGNTTTLRPEVKAGVLIGLYSRLDGDSYNHLHRASPTQRQKILTDYLRIHADRPKQIP